MEIIGDNPDLSIVIAAWPDVRGLRDCLKSIVAQRDKGVLVIVSGSLAADRGLVNDFPDVTWLESHTNFLIPQLWALGIERAQGNVVAMTTAHFIPADDWITQMREAHVQLSAAGIGGAIDAPAGRKPVAWATYFLRYSNYLNLHREGAVPEIAADNASYKRHALEAHRETIRDGFWEPDFHRLLFAAGESLAFVPAIRVRLNVSSGFRNFFLQRMQHGCHFGAARVRQEAAALRLARIAGAPLIPLVLLAKITARVLRSRTHFAAFLISLPVLVLFILAWAAGEAWGYLSARRQRAPRREHSWSI